MLEAATHFFEAFDIFETRPRVPQRAALNGQILPVKKAILLDGAVTYWQNVEKFSNIPRETGKMSARFSVGKAMRAEGLVAGG
jgi:hypothetical protein